MLPVKSKFKIAKRLGAGIFEQTQSQKFALSEARSKKKEKRGGRGGSDYGRQLLEKQKVRFTYGLSERQLSNYAEKAFDATEPSKALHVALESRIDSAIYRLGFAPTRRAARQMVSHGHIKINGTRTTVPSQHLKKGDVIEVREGSKSGILFASLTEKENMKAVPNWLKSDVSALKATVEAEPAYSLIEGSGLDYATVFEFYSR